jgi:hypothetical protein
MLLAARALGLGATLTTLYLQFEKEAEATLGLPPGVHSYALLPIGYPMGRFGPVAELKPQLLPDGRIRFVPDSPVEGDGFEPSVPRDSDDGFRLNSPARLLWRETHGPNPCKGARANHVGAALSRHKRAGRIEERDGKLYAIQSPRTSNRLRSDTGIKEWQIRPTPWPPTPRCRHSVVRY